MQAFFSHLSDPAKYWRHGQDHVRLDLDGRVFGDTGSGLLRPAADARSCRTRLTPVELEHAGAAQTRYLPTAARGRPDPKGSSRLHGRQSMQHARDHGTPSTRRLTSNTQHDSIPRAGGWPAMIRPLFSRPEPAAPVPRRCPRPQACPKKRWAAMSARPGRRGRELANCHGDRSESERATLSSSRHHPRAAAESRAERVPALPSSLHSALGCACLQPLLFATSRLSVLLVSFYLLCSFFVFFFKKLSFLSMYYPHL
jgi:hypothetical protein